MSTNESINTREAVVAGLDFEQIKRNLKLYLKSQDQFKDYNFEASSINVLLDILAYNTHYNAFYTNMLINESFLDSAVVRDSVVSLAKHLGYVPRSAQGAECLVDVELLVEGLDRNIFLDAVRTRSLKITKFDTFKTINNENETFYFYATDSVEFDVEYESSIPKFFARNVKLREGNVKLLTFTVDNSNPNQKFILPETDIDTRSIEIKIQKSINSTEGINDNWFTQVNFNDLGPETKVFFVQEIYGGKYELYFGDGILGKKPSHGNVITVVYSTTKGSLANNTGRSETLTNFTFSYSGQGAISRVSLKRDENGDVIPAAGGSEKETISSIKFYSPKTYASQDRAVTLQDYVNYLSGSYSDAFKSVYAWGGEDNDPPEYGKVFISVRPKSSQKLTLTEKENLEKNVLRSKNLVSVTPKIVDPDYTFIIPEIAVKYKNEELNFTPAALKSQILQSVFVFNEGNMSVFNRNFYASELESAILDIHPAIKSCNVDIKIKKYISPVFDRKFTYKVNFDNKLEKIKNKNYYIETSLFNTNDLVNNFALPSSTYAFLRDNGLGRIQTLKNSELEDILVTLNNNQGVIDYENGNMTISNLVVYRESIGSNSQISFTVNPTENDIIANKNSILEIEMPSVSVTLTRV